MRSATGPNFTNTARGSNPGSLTASSSAVTVNLSSLPAGTNIYRAILVPHVAGNTGGAGSNVRSTTPLRVQAADAAGVWLQAFGPQYMTLDCTAAAQRAVQAADRTLRLDVVSWTQWYAGQEVRLDVWCDATAPHSIRQAMNTQAVHRNGDTMITFGEVNTPITKGDPTGLEYGNAVAGLDAASEIRYRVYRSSSPIDAVTVRTAELVDEIKPLSGWNGSFYGIQRDSSWSTSIMPRLPVADMTLADVGTGIYVRRAAAAQTVYYAVSRAVDGEEDLSLWTPGGNCTSGAVAEATGTGMVLQWQTTAPTSFYYVDNPTMYYFVRWECPPTYNVPSTAHNYLVGVPPAPADPRPVDVALHCWGGWMEACYGWWYEAESGGLLLATNQIPWDWWSGYHDNYGTIRPFADVEGNGGGVVGDYTHNRIWSFLCDFVAVRWNVDFDHVMVSGTSMGGSGSCMWGIRAGDKFCYIDSWVGVHIPRLSPTYAGSYAGVWGLDSWNCLFEDTGMSVWDYWDDNQWLRSHVTTDTPFVCFANGKNDSGIGWQQAWMFAKALQETRRPHLFTWGQQAHQQRAQQPGMNERWIGVTIDKNKTLPAFTYCSLDNDPGNGDPAVGDPAGYLNAYLLWQPDGSTDTAGRWEMTSYLINAAPASTCTVDVTPRRCQVFHPRPAMACRWTNTDVATGGVIASGVASVDANGLITVPQATVAKTKNRIVLTIVGDIDQNGGVDVVDLLFLANSWARRTGEPGFSAACDLDIDGTVDVVDLLWLADNWAK